MILDHMPSVPGPSGVNLWGSFITNHLKADRGPLKNTPRSRHLSGPDSVWGESDHLAYLDRRPDIFNHRDSRKIRETDLVCRDCGHKVTQVAERIEIWGSHDYTFGNLGYPVRLGCFRNAPGCIGTQRVSHGYSWFRGYAWQIQLCSKCHAQLGWEYMSPDDSFYGLIFGMLRESQAPEEPDGQGQGQS